MHKLCAQKLFFEITLKSFFVLNLLKAIQAWNAHTLTHSILNFFFCILLNINGNKALAKYPSQSTMFHIFNAFFVRKFGTVAWKISIDQVEFTVHLISETSGFQFMKVSVAKSTNLKTEKSIQLIMKLVIWKNNWLKRMINFMIDWLYFSVLKLIKSTKLWAKVWTFFG